MGLFDFARNAGAKIGLGKSTSEIKAQETAKIAAEKAAEQAVADKAAKEAAAKAKAATDATQKEAAEKAAGEAMARANAAKIAAAKAAQEARDEASKSTALEEYVTKLGLPVTNLDIRYNDGCAYVGGECATQADLEKLVLAVGNVTDVSRVIDTVKVAAESEASQFHTVVSGDTLSKIAKHYYGDATKYPVIFEANKPLLKDPDEIYPGQSLRIPALV
jgi:nucleoid-associated protein YgaU